MTIKQWIRGFLLAEVIEKLAELLRKVNEMSAANDLLVAKVSELKTVVESAVALINGFLAQIKDAATMTEVQAVVAEIERQKTELADAVAANTPAEPPVE